jgi:hypothetical protein
MVVKISRIFTIKEIEDKDNKEKKKNEIKGKLHTVVGS